MPYGNVAAYIVVLFWIVVITVVVLYRRSRSKG